MIEKELSPKVLVIIPAYNEEKNIAKVIDSVKKENKNYDIIVINDGSKDRTGEIAAGTKDAFVVNLPMNLGIGGAVQTGFKFAKINHYDIVLQFDGDGQHRASEIPKIIDPILKDEVDLMIGSRFCQKNGGFQSTFFRRIGIKIFQIINSVLIKQKITDNTSGFRAYNKKAIDFITPLYPADYPEPEAVILLGKNGFRIKEVFTEMNPREGGKSSIAGLKTAYYMIKVLLAIFINAIRPKILKNP